MVIVEPATWEFWTFWFPHAVCATDSTCTPSFFASCTSLSSSRRNPGSAAARRLIAAASATTRDGLSGTSYALANAVEPAVSPSLENRSRSQRSNRVNDAFAASGRSSPPFSAALVSNVATTAPNVNDTGSTTDPSHQTGHNTSMMPQGPVGDPIGHGVVGIRMIRNLGTGITPVNGVA